MTEQKRPPRAIGASGLACFPLGLGCASLSGSYGPSDDDNALRVLHEARARGVTMFDTSDKYGAGHNEELLARAFDDARNSVLIASKFGNMAGKDGKIADNSPQLIEASCEASLKRLKRDCIDLYYIHRIDPAVAIEDTIGAMSRLVEQGKVRALGICEVNPTTLRRAHKVHPIAAIQSEYSILYRAEAEDVLQTTRELGVAFVAYAPLGRGLLTGAVQPGSLGDKDERLRHPRFSAENLPKNLELAQAVQKVASDRGCSAGQVSLAWLLAQGDDIIPIPGTKTMSRLIENIEAAAIILSDAEIGFIASSIPPDAAAGLRYRAEHMKNMYL
jgi:aryl-alcohol dehydrogenase-like predicted oxidoreductase